MAVRSVSKHYLSGAGDGAGEGVDGVSKRVPRACSYMWLHVR